MAVVVFSKSVAFPIAPLREQLNRALPLYSWQVGEDDTGAPKQTGVFRRRDLITGRSSATVIFTEVAPTFDQFPELAPPHQWYLTIGRPTTELAPIADRILLIVAMVSMILDEDDARCQLFPGGNWLSAPELLRVLKLVTDGEPLSIAQGLGMPADRLVAAPAAPHGSGVEGAVDPSRPGGELPALIVLADRQLPIDAAALERMARDVDPDGGWTVEHSRGQIVLIGRGTVLGVMDMPSPLPLKYLAGNWERSSWFEGDRTAVERHTRQVTVKAMLDTRKADWVDIRQTAKIASLAACWVARQPGALAIVNLDVGTIFEAKDGASFLKHLSADQLPVALLSWTKWHALDDGDVSLSTSGLTPFLGHELEAWHVPLTADEVRTIVSDLIIYLLDRGPVIGHNDTAGRTKGDKSIRCFLESSRAERAVPTRALILEFDAEPVGAPKPDLAAAGVAPTGNPLVDRAFATLMPRLGPQPTLTSYVALTKPVSYAREDMLRELGDRITGYRWSGDESAQGLNVPRLVTGTGAAGTVTVRIIGETVPLGPEFGAPPHRLHLRVETDAGADRALAGRVAAVVCACLPLFQDPAAHGRLSPASKWLVTDDLLTAMSMAKFAPSMAAIAPDCDVAPARTPPPPPSPPPLRRAGGFGRKGL